MNPLSLRSLTPRPGFRAELPGEVLSLPLTDYDAARRLQWRLHEERVSEIRPDTLVLLEHEPVLTLGRTARDAHWNGSGAVSGGHGLRVIASERGGSVTYHGPGQVVGYPIVKLKHFCSGPKAYMRMLEEVIIRVLSNWGIRGRRVDKFVGVWVQDPVDPDGPLAKIAAMGVKITRGVTLHGFALNVTVDLAPYAGIVPCGIEGCRVTSMAEVLRGTVAPNEVRDRIARCFGDVFGLDWKGKTHGTSDSEIPHARNGARREPRYRPQPPLT